jgi:hypothetical protein
VTQEARKKFVRTPWVQSALAWLVATYVGVALATMRWRIEGRAAADAAIACRKAWSPFSGMDASPCRWRAARSWGESRAG